MTIASEITRLQNDKAAIKTAIENKGVTVGNVTLDSYASCIDAISSGATVYCINSLLVGGGGGGSSGFGGGGGGGGVECYSNIVLNDTTISVTVGAAGSGAGAATSSKGCAGCPGGNSMLCDSNKLIAKAIGGGGGSHGYFCNRYIHSADGGHSGGGCKGGQGYDQCVGAGGGGGAGGNGSNGSSKVGGAGGTGKCGFGGGGGGGGYSTQGTGKCGGGNGGHSGGCAATNYGGGGGGSMDYSCKGGNGYKGVVDICYASDGSYGFTTATGGNCCYVCGGMCVHRFTSDGTFTIVS